MTRKRNTIELADEIDQAPAKPIGWCAFPERSGGLLEFFYEEYEAEELAEDGRYWPVYAGIKERNAVSRHRTGAVK